MFQMLEMSPDNRKLMGKNGRKKIISEFDENIVIKEYLKALKGSIKI